jgi:hypothetical protein
VTQAIFCQFCTQLAHGIIIENEYKPARSVAKVAAGETSGRKTLYKWEK